VVALVIDGQRDPVLSEQLRGLYGATPGQRDVLIESSAQEITRGVVPV